jgi:hypothetical protein
MPLTYHGAETAMRAIGARVSSHIVRRKFGMSALPSGHLT